MFSKYKRSVPGKKKKNYTNPTISLHPGAKQLTRSQTERKQCCSYLLNDTQLSWICTLHIQCCCMDCRVHTNWVFKVLQCCFLADAEVPNLATHKAELIRVKQLTEGRVSVSGGKSVCPFHLIHNGKTPPSGCSCTQICLEAWVFVNRCSHCSHLTGLPDR